jgi:hypothetical protein
MLALPLALTLASATADPRHFFDPRCPPAALPDGPDQVRFLPSRVFLTQALPANATLLTCATACCGDWSCIAYAFQPPQAAGPLSGTYTNHDSLRGTSLLSLQQSGPLLSATSMDPARAFWTHAEGLLAPDGVHLFLVFDGEARNNRTGALSADRSAITLERLPMDPANFTQVFTLVAHSNSTAPSCAFMDELPPLAPRGEGVTLQTGSRALLPPPHPPPYPASTYIAATVSATALLGMNGDEFPTTWASNGDQLTGAGDNIQPSAGIPQRFSSPASFFRLTAASPLDAAFPSAAFALQGGAFPLSNTSLAKGLCRGWGGGLANIKSSGVIETGGSTFWAVACFDYGDQPDFNRQRYGPSWIASSADFGVSWTSQAGELWGGRLAAPRFVQAGQGNAGAPDAEHIYALFPGTTDNASFFECNDAAWLGRAPVADPAALPRRGSWEYYVGSDAAGGAQWDADDSLAVPVLDWPLHPSVQQANWHAGLGRFILANWVWLSMDGYPRPDHSPDQRQGRTARQRTWLTLLEAPALQGPWSVFYSDAQWQYADGSSGAYTPVFPPRWINATDNSFWMVSTQCCTGDTTFPPENHYSFNAQLVTVQRL